MSGVVQSGAAPLPAKEAQIYRSILVMHERKQFKKALKATDSILSKVPNHGETLALRGLVLNSLNRKEDAYDSVKKGLKNNVMSNVCWHVYGLLYRSDKNYDEAMKCYKNALKRDKDSLNILRDLANLQVQIRDYAGFKETRFRLFNLKPGLRFSWIAAAVSNDLLGDYMGAYRVLDKFDVTNKSMETKLKATGDNDAERTEFALYKNSLLERAGEIKQALEHLDTIKPMINSHVEWKEAKARLFVKQGQWKEAENVYWRLLDDNANNLSYVDGLEECARLEAGVDSVDDLPTARRLTICEEVLTRYPHARQATLRPLYFTHGDDFASRVSVVLQKYLQKGVPSVFETIRSLYRTRNAANDAKIAIISGLIDSFIAKLTESRQFVPEGAEVPASALMWTLYVQAQHYDALGELSRALESINRALEHTPTNVDLYMCKAKIYKHGGDLMRAAETMNAARELDTADRYVNSKCVKYLLMSDQIKRACDTSALFTREGMDSVDNLTEMQCQWFQAAAGDSYRRTSDYGMALKNYHSIDAHYTQFTDDQFDFHVYCLRRVALRAYVNTIRMDEFTREHRFFVRAAQNAIEVYMDLFDRPKGGSGAGTAEEDAMANLSESERKKLLSKQRRAQRRADEAKALVVSKKNDDGPSNADTDPKGEALAKTEKPLEEAKKRFLAPLQRLRPKDIRTHLLSFDVYLRCQKPLLMLQSLARAARVDVTSPEVAQRAVIFKHKLSEMTVSATAQSVIDSVFPGLVSQVFGEGTDSAGALCGSLVALAERTGTVAFAVAAARALAVCSPTKTDTSMRLLVAAAKAKPSEASLESATAAVKLLQGMSGSDEALSAVKAALHAFMPLSVVLGAAPLPADQVGPSPEKPTEPAKADVALLQSSVSATAAIEPSSNTQAKRKRRK